MTTLTFPDIGAPARLRWRLISNTMVGLSPLSKSVQTYELPGARWGFTAEFPPLDNVSQATRRRSLMRAFLAQLGGQAGRFAVHNWEAASVGGSGLLGKYGVLPGVAGNYFSTPDSATLDIVGDLDIRVKLTPNDWTPVGDPYLVAKNGFTTGGGYHFRLLSGGALQLQWSNGAVQTTAFSSALTGFVDGSTHWVRATLDVDRGGSPTEYQVTFYTSEDGTTWTQLGAVFNGAGPALIAANAEVFAVGIFNDGSASPLAGRIHYAEVRNGINGTVVAEFDPSDWTSGTTWISDTGEVWTINSSGSPSSGIVAFSGASVRGASQTGNSLSTQGWKNSASGILLPGDFFGVNGELKMVTGPTAIDADNYGNATVTFAPPLRSSPADGAVLDLTSPEAVFMLTDSTVEWAMESGNLFADFVIDAVEAF